MARRCLWCDARLEPRSRAELCRSCVAEILERGLDNALLGELYRRLDHKADGPSNTFSDATLSDHFVDHLARHVPRESRVVEVGAGGGYLAAALSRRGFTNVVATDFNGPALAVVARRFPELRLAAMDAGRLALASTSVDVVIAVEMVEHLLEPAAHFREVARVLRPGGLYLARTPNLLAATLYYHLARRYDMDIWHPSTFSSGRLARALAAHGFRVEHLAPPALPPSQVAKLPRPLRLLSRLPLSWVPHPLRPSIVCAARKPADERS